MVYIHSFIQKKKYIYIGLIYIFRKFVLVENIIHTDRKLYLVSIWEMLRL